MKTLLQYIQENPVHFINTCYARSKTTPSEENRKNHLNLMLCIERSMWGEVEAIINTKSYQRPLQGVLVCLKTYSNIDDEVYSEIYDNFVGRVY